VILNGIKIPPKGGIELLLSVILISVILYYWELIHWQAQPFFLRRHLAITFLEFCQHIGQLFSISSRKWSQILWSFITERLLTDLAYQGKWSQPVSQPEWGILCLLQIFHVSCTFVDHQLKWQHQGRHQTWKMLPIRDTGPGRASVSCYFFIDLIWAFPPTRLTEIPT